jgi:hypothetical protein
MADLGEIAEFVNNEEFSLEVGSDMYTMVRDLQIKIGRPEERRATNDSGPSYAYGQGDNFFACTLVVTTPELSTLNTLTQPTAGEFTSTAWKLKANNVSAAAKTFAATGILRDYVVRKGEQGKLLIDIFVRITGDTVTIS